MRAKNNGKRYNDDFKKMIVDLYHSGSAVKDLSSEYGVSDVTIYKWIKNVTPIEGTGEKEITSKDVEARLVLGKAKRNQYAQRTIGGPDRLPNDDGGHLIASIFKGSGEIDNLVPMNATLNRKEYKAIEAGWKKALEAGKKVSVKVKPIYEGASSRPTEFKISYTIDGKKYSDRLTNYRGGS